jgi:DNA-binding transcriptional LysR family regulator
MYRVRPVIELRDLRSVGALVDELHFGRAASRLGVTPSTLSRRIRAIEQELGVLLFIRTSRRVALTDAGRELARRAAPPRYRAGGRPHARRWRVGSLTASRAAHHGSAITVVASSLGKRRIVRRVGRLNPQTQVETELRLGWH